MKRSLTLLALAGLSLFMHAHAKRPNIIFFIADDMLPNHFNCLQQGKDKYLTPNLDRLAREGTLATTACGLARLHSESLQRPHW